VKLMLRFVVSSGLRQGKAVSQSRLRTVRNDPHHIFEKREIVPPDIIMAVAKDDCRGQYTETDQPAKAPLFELRKGDRAHQRKSHQWEIQESLRHENTDRHDPIRAGDKRNEDKP